MSANNERTKGGRLRSGNRYQNIREDHKPNQLYPDLDGLIKSDEYIDESEGSNEELDENTDSFDTIRKRHFSNDFKFNNKQLREMTANKKQQKDTKSSMNWSIFFILIFIAVLISYFKFGTKSLKSIIGNEEPFNRSRSLQTFETELIGIEGKYAKVLSDLGIKVMKKAVKTVVYKNNSEPAVILLIGSKEQKAVIDCIEKDLVNAINKAYNEKNTTKINGKQTNSKDIIEKFEQTFGSEGKHTIIIENIESISTDHVMSLHQFTDHTNARFVDSIIIMTAINYQKIHLNKSCGMREMDEIASKLFEIKWKNSMAEDQRNALISRLTPSVVTILNGANDQIIC